jgi:hypothetical protein
LAIAVGGVFLFHEMELETRDRVSSGRPIRSIEQQDTAGSVDDSVMAFRTAGQWKRGVMRTLRW